MRSASRVAGDVPSLKGGEGCVNTQTGSVSVAGSQSNTVCGDTVCGGTIYEYEECAQNVYEDKNPYRMKTQYDSMCVLSGLSLSKPTFNNLASKYHNTDRKPTQRLEVRSIPSSSLNSTSRLKDYFSKLNTTHNNFVGKEGQGKITYKGRNCRLLQNAN